MTPRQRQSIKVGIVTTAVVILLILLLQNTRPVTVTILFQSFSMPLIILLVVTCAISFGLGYLVHSLALRKRR